MAILRIVYLIVGSCLAIHGFRKERNDWITGWGGILIIILTATMWIAEWYKQIPRTISPSAREAMIERLNEYSGQSIQLGYITDDPEVIAFVQQLEEVLAASGWDIHKGNFPGGLPFVDVFIGLIEEEPPESAQAFANSLHDAGIAFTMAPYIKPPSEAADFWIIVCKKKE